MIKLYGMSYSNYYNVVKTVLLEKNISFEEVYVTPNQEPDYLDKSPMGKVPCIETEAGFLTETTVILDYLEDFGAGPSFYPPGAFEKAKVRELIKYMELYVELPARRLYGDVFFKRPVGDDEKQAVRILLQKGFDRLYRLAKFTPYLAGESVSYADFYFRFALSPPLIVCKKALDWNAYSELHEIGELMKLMDQRVSVQQVVAAQSQPA